MQAGGMKKKRKQAQSGPESETTSKSKKANQNPAAVCSSCRGRGTGHAAIPWAQLEYGKPKGDQCAACKSLHDAGFSCLSWVEFVALRGSEDWTR